MSKKIEISKEGYLELIQKIYDNKIEERELALDRYRKADDEMTSTEQFVLMGKNAISFLNLVSISTNDMANLAKEIKSIVYKDESGNQNSSEENLSDDFKKQIVDELELIERKDK